MQRLLDKLLCQKGTTAPGTIFVLLHTHCSSWCRCRHTQQRLLPSDSAPCPAWSADGNSRDHVLPGLQTAADEAKRKLEQAEERLNTAESERDALIEAFKERRQSKDGKEDQVLYTDSQLVSTCAPHDGYCQLIVSNDT